MDIFGVLAIVDLQQVCYLDGSCHLVIPFEEPRCGLFDVIEVFCVRNTLLFLIDVFDKD